MFTVQSDDRATARFNITDMAYHPQTVRKHDAFHKKESPKLVMILAADTIGYAAR